MVDYRRVDSRTIRALYYLHRSSANQQEAVGPCLAWASEGWFWV